MEQITYIKTGDYYVPDWKLPEEARPIGRWGRMHRDYLKDHRPVIFNEYSGRNRAVRAESECRSSVKSVRIARR